MKSLLNHIAFIICMTMITCSAIGLVITLHDEYAKPIVHHTYGAN